MNRFDFQIASDSSGDEPTVIHTTVPKKIGGYELIEMLGEGGMGAIFLARHIKLGRRVALKLIRPDLVRNPDVIKRFEREMLSIGSLHHPNVLLAYDAGIDAGYPYLATEHIEGVDAQKLIDYEGRLSIGNSVEIVRQALLGIAHAATCDIVHRDLKPANLLVSDQGIVKVADLGVARLNDADTETLTATNLIIGTPDFLSPEQARGDWEVTTSADIYSLGCTLYNLLAGERPFSGADFNTPLKKVKAHEEIEVPPITNFRSDIPEELAGILEKMMAKDPQVRGEDPALIAEQLKRFDAGADLPPIVRRVSERIKESAPEIRVTWITSTTDGSVLSEDGVTTGSSLKTAATGTAAESGIDAKEQRSKGRRVWVAALFLLLAVGGTASALFFGNKEDEDPPPKVEEGVPHFTAGEFPGQFVPIPIDRAEVRIEGDPTRKANFHVSGKQITFDAPTFGILELGTVDSADFRLRFDFSQTRWTGGCGICIASREGIVEDRTGYAVMLMEMLKEDENPFVMWAAEVSQARTTTGRISYPITPIDQVSIKEKGGEIPLVIEYRNGILSSVRIHGAKVDFDPEKLGRHQLKGEISIGLIGFGSTFKMTSPEIQIIPTTNDN